jgi:hypothetical protein
MDSLDVGVVSKGIFSELSSDTTLLEASERHVGMQLVVAVDPDSTAVGDKG